MEQAQQQKMLQERQNAAFRDAQAGLNLINDGNYDGFISLGVNRLQSLRNFPDANPEDTQRLVKLGIAARNGDEEAGRLLKNELGSLVEMGQAYGVLKAPETKVVGDALVTESGEVLYKGDEAPKLQIVQRASDGNIQTLQTDERGNFYDLRGNPVNLDPSDRIIEGTTLTGGAEDLGLPKSEATELRNSEIATSQFIATANDALDMLEQTPDINTFTAKAAGIVNDLQQEAKSLASATGIEFDTDLLDPSNHADTFDALGIQNRRMQSIITSLGYSRALANNPDGRISNADLNAAIREIGGSASDPRAFAEVLQDNIRRTVRGFEINYRIRSGNDYDGDLGVVSSQPQEVTTQQQYDSLPSGAIYLENGQRYRKP